MTPKVKTASALTVPHVQGREKAYSTWLRSHNFTASPVCAREGQGFSCPLIFQHRGWWFFFVRDMSYYRDVYLKSDDWKNLRRAALARRHNKCQLCRHKSKSNDVHHVRYKNLWDVSLKDLKVLCRPCHDWVHGLLKKYPKMKKLKPHKLWRQVQLHYTKAERYARIKPKVTVLNRIQLFGASKKALFEAGLICKRRMPCLDWLLENEEFRSTLPFPEAMLAAYIKITGRDPRRLIPDIRRAA